MVFEDVFSQTFHARIKINKETKEEKKKIYRKREHEKNHSYQRNKDVPKADTSILGLLIASLRHRLLY